MNNKLFREKSIERVNSPEQLNEYIRVARPGVWVMLSAIVLMLIGVVFWGIYGNIETTVNAAAFVKGGEATVYMKMEEAFDVKEGAQAQIVDKTGSIESLSAAPIQLDALEDAALLQSGVLTADDFYYTATVDVSGLPDGEYTACVVAESIRPITFVIH